MCVDRCSQNVFLWKEKEEVSNKRSTSDKAGHIKTTTIEKLSAVPGLVRRGEGLCRNGRRGRKGDIRLPE